MTEWQPIETAPRDKNILLSTNYEPFRVTEGWWDAPEHGEYLGDCGGECRCPEYADAPEPMWMSTDGGFTKEHPPTHWMLLPSPPQTGGRIEERHRQSYHRCALQSSSERKRAAAIAIHRSIYDLDPAEGIEMALYEQAADAAFAVFQDGNDT